MVSEDWEQQRRDAASHRQRRAQANLRKITAPRKLRRPYYAARRVPQTFSPTFLRRRLLPLAPLALGAIGATLASALPIGDEAQDRAWQLSEKLSTQLTERSQRLYFDNPGFDTLTVRALATHAHRITRLGKWLLRAKVAVGWDKDGRAATMIPLLPTRSYDSLMVSMLVVGTALGYLAGGPVHPTLTYDSGADKPRLDLPPGHPRPNPRRLSAPRVLSDTGADIDDLYWAGGRGQCIKVVAVGEAPNRRWVVSIPGTSHMDPTSNANPADFESNIREALNMPSGMRVGVVRAVHDAMKRVGVRDHQSEAVLMAGHSQGGMVATALASAPPSSSGLTVRGVLTTGSPNRRMRIRSDVTMLSVAHDQDVVPSVDGSADRTIDHRVVVRRHLNRPRTSPLYYAHASMTYTATLRDMERRALINPFGQIPAAIEALSSFIPQEGEESRVFIYDIWQEILEPCDQRTWDTVAALDQWTWEPLPSGTDYAPTPLIPYDTISASLDGLRKWWTNEDPQ